ncbi:MAG: hypothetical protein SF052_07485 [Bacteroidia bacterium]|nr:hypothetical protein [Bacteroidia bacterium]
MPKIFLLLLFGGLGMINFTFAQTLFLSHPTLPGDSAVTFSPGIRFSTCSSGESQFTSRSINSSAPLHILPSYAQENPSGYSWLCRMELKIENELPIGVWVKAGDSGGIVNSTGNNLHLKLKLFRF